jgi:hypothetical protein
MKRLRFFLSLAMILLFVVFCAAAFQTNVGAYHISPGGFFEVSGAQLFETSAGSGGNVGLLGNASNSLFVTQNDGATKLGSLAAVQLCGTATACSLTQPSALKEVVGSCTASAATTCTITGLPFTGTTTYFCFVSDATTAANGALKVANASASSTVITTASSSDTFNYDCKGT